MMELSCSDEELSVPQPTKDKENKERKNKGRKIKDRNKEMRSFVPSRLRLLGLRMTGFSEESKKQKLFKRDFIGPPLNSRNNKLKQQ